LQEKYQFVNNENIIYDGIRDILGIKSTENGIEVDWGLIQFEFKK